MGLFLGDGLWGSVLECRLLRGFCRYYPNLLRLCCRLIRWIGFEWNWGILLFGWRNRACRWQLAPVLAIMCKVIFFGGESIWLNGLRLICWRSSWYRRGWVPCQIFEIPHLLLFYLLLWWINLKFSSNSQVKLYSIQLYWLCPNYFPGGNWALLACRQNYSLVYWYFQIYPIFSINYCSSTSILLNPHRYN